MRIPAIPLLPLAPPRESSPDPDQADTPGPGFFVDFKMKNGQHRHVVFKGED